MQSWLNSIASPNAVRFAPASLLLTTCPAAADPFAIVAGDANEIVAIDLGDIQPPAAGTVRFWQVTRYIKAPYTLKGKAVTRLAEQYEVKCASKEFTRIYLFAYGVDGNVIDNGPIQKLEWMPTPPASHLIDLHRIACEGASDTDPIVDDLEHLTRTHDSFARERQ